VRRIGLVGCGGMGRWHAARWRALPAALAAVYGLPAYKTLNELLSASEIVDICTPPTDHAATAIAAAEAGLHVVCEKPIARHLADARAMIAACEKAGVHLFIAHVVRFFPEFARAKEVLDSGALGRLGVVRTVRGGSRPTSSSWFSNVAMSGGVILDVAIHDIDYLRWVCGDVQRVFVRGLTFRDLPADHALISLRFANGTIGHIEASWAYPPGSWRTFLELAGTEGLLVHDSDDVRPLEVKYAPDASPAQGAHEQASFDDDPWYLELKHFLEILDGGATPRVTAQDGLAALRVALAAIESMRTGLPIDVATFEEAA
jgi:UDP-N-acetylglucosamine 3-dehydrogenase